MAVTRTAWRIALLAALLSVACGCTHRTRLPARPAPSVSASAASTSASSASAPSGSSSSAPGRSPTTTSGSAPRPAPTAPPLVLQVADDPTFGRILLDAGFHPLYYDRTVPGGHIASCEPTCLTDWQPLILTPGTVLSSGGAVSVLGTVHRADGRLQVEAYGHALYRFRHDPAGGGAVTGNGRPPGWMVATAHD